MPPHTDVYMKEREYVYTRMCRDFLRCSPLRSDGLRGKNSRKISVTYMGSGYLFIYMGPSPACPLCLQCQGDTCAHFEVFDKKCFIDAYRMLDPHNAGQCLSTCASACVFFKSVSVSVSVSGLVSVSVSFPLSVLSLSVCTFLSFRYDSLLHVVLAYGI